MPTVIKIDLYKVDAFFKTQCRPTKAVVYYLTTV